jgi:tartrate-resistant acid phosphatase type 5
MQHGVLLLGLLIVGCSWLEQGAIVLPPGAAYARSFAPQDEPHAPEQVDSALCWIVLGDWGTGGAVQRQVAAAMSALAHRAPVHFILSVGDNIYPAGVRSAQDPQWESKFARIYADSLLQVPWYPVLGNHDYRGDPDAQIAYSRRNPLWHMPARYYVVEKPLPDGTLAAFVALDTQQLLNGNPQQRARQLRWLEEQLRRSSAQWKFVFGHHPLRSAGLYGENATLLRLLKPIFERYGVAVYFCGHEHDLQLLKHPEDGFYCVVSGAGSSARPTGYSAASIFAAAEPGFVYAQLRKQRLSLWVIDSAGRVRYRLDVPQRRELQ